MKVAIHQPQYWPWPPYLDKVADADLFIVLDTVDFQKNGLQNRNQIKAAAGAQWLTVPVKQRLGQSLLETAVDNTQNWRRKHWSAIEQNYRKAPHFARYAPELQALYEQPWERLTELNLRILELLRGWLGIETPVRRSSGMKAAGKASELVLNLCREAGATRYLSGSGGKDYLDQAAFAAAGVEIVWQAARPSRPYPQQHPAAGFVPGLSALDALLNCGPERVLEARPAC